ncbi:translation initiation factor eiF2 beta-subunit (nucleomorph) [Chroomonas mesostigmatica CCMP1168]|uniref:Translation initiation factor eiF2 beta-subunit n=1 Tax=Chroomonas mesostigmatica CCMP1168 TaxID=1195612 RepID=J7G2A9_9CRYP|nr:translation initiation factor eiF2 beta-subunit [Chroomonas mesostigmatica CCMP1168]|mmetsp:Transcript_33146/g.81400  ORF Transcript_33146/g.81400 Transcript_33146/m.81400 type:complete len:169 (-) Transcript_33146:2132-2638(-)
MKKHKYNSTNVSSESEYYFLLDRLIQFLDQNEFNFSYQKRLSIQSPQIGRDGSKKTIFINFEIICTKLERNKEHLFYYISTELGTTASIQEGGGLVLKGRFQPKGIENVLKNYIKEYVLCDSCNSPKTILKKDLATRLIFLRCLRCGAWRSVFQIRPGFVAQTKKRKT